MISMKKSSKPQGQVCLSINLIVQAKQKGFIDVRVSGPKVDWKCLDRLLKNNKNDYNASMKWLERNPKGRMEAASLLDNAKSVICFAHPIPIGEIKRPTFARFAQGEDYHKVLKTKLSELVKLLEKECPEIKTKICVDTSPIFEKAFAANAGLGWIGKNTLLIHPSLGSNIVLGEIITDVEFMPDEKIEIRCGSCQKCIEACPTGALVEPYVLDSRKCIAYYTTVNDVEIPEEIKEHISYKDHGCDRCVDICPYSCNTLKRS